MFNGSTESAPCALYAHFARLRTVACRMDSRKRSMHVIILSSSLVAQLVRLQQFGTEAVLSDRIIQIEVGGSSAITYNAASRRPDCQPWCIPTWRH